MYIPAPKPCAAVVPFIITIQNNQLKMKTLQITESNARKLYKDASPEFKTTLEDTFGKDFFSQSITDRVKTYEDACAELGEIPLNEAECLRLGFTKDEIVRRKLITIGRALNEGWVGDIYSNDYRYYPYFSTGSSPSSFAFYGTGCAYVFARAGSGSRLSYKTRELAKYSGVQFLDLWRELIQPSN